MNTQIVTTFDQDADYQKVITVTREAFTMEHWAATLGTEDQQECKKQCRLHNIAVDSAVAAGDARVTHNINNATVEWRTEEIHQHWMNTINAEDHAGYHSFWTRYQAAMAERKE